MVMAVKLEQMDCDEQPDGGRTSNTGAVMFCTVAPIAPWTFPAMNTVINCPGATVTGGYRYPIPTTVFADALWPNAPGKTAAHQAIAIGKHFIIPFDGGCLNEVALRQPFARGPSESAWMRF
jgi:hypothetical protein